MEDYNGCFFVGNTARNLMMDSRAFATWFHSRWFVICLALPLAGCVAIAVAFPAADAFVAGELGLWLAFVASLRILSDQRLLNPVQAGALLFYFWFGVGPVVILLFGLSAGIGDEAWRFYPAGTNSLPFVACGLVFYALAARAGARFVRSRGWGFRWLAAGQTSLEGRTLVTFFLLGGGLVLLLEVLPALGIQGISSVNFLGGKRTDIWWVGVLDTLSTVLALANVVAISSIVAPRLRRLRHLPLIGIAVLLFLLARSLSSGWKGQFLFPMAWVAIAFLTERQRPPLILLASLAAVFLLFLEPFVFEARNETRIRGVVDPAGRVEVFQEVLQKQLQGNWREPDPSSQMFHLQALFRGIFPLAGGLLERCTATEGPWHGDTIEGAVFGIIPRAFYPEKPDGNTGNFFSRDVGGTMGLLDPANEENSVAISIPIEIAGNLGWLLGLASFAILGFIWATLSALVLGPDPALHPWNPYFVLTTVLFESPLVALLAQGRDFLILGAFIALVWRLQGWRL